MTKIGIFIPCYNVERSIRAVLNDFSAEVLSQIDEILVIDNVSQDKTLDILRNIQAKEKIGEKLVILKNAKNYGLGGSQKIAYQYFLDHDFSHFMIIHGDGQGNSDEIAKFFLGVFKHKKDIDLVLASRFHPQANTAGYSGIRRIGNHFFNFMTYLLTGHKISDAGTGVMFIRTALLKQLPFLSLTDSFQFNPQLNILFYNLKGLVSAEVPLNWKDSASGSNIQSLHYCLTLFKILVKYRINKSLLNKAGAKLFNDQQLVFKPEFETIWRSA